MGWMNPPMPWKEIEQKLSDRPEPALPRDKSEFPEWANGGDSPAWSRKREQYESGAVRTRGSTPYAELHCHSSFSFLDGASDPEDLVEEAARLGLEALAITDHDGFYAVPRFSEAARAVGLPTIFGAELTLGHPRPPKSGAMPEPDPHGSHLLLLARDPNGYAALARVISESQLAGEKTAPNMTFSDLDNWLKPGEVNHLIALTGCRKGMVRAALESEGPAVAERELSTLVDLFGPDGVVVELWDHGSPLDSARNDALVQLAVRRGLNVIASNNVHYATPSKHKLASAMSAVRARSSLEDMAGWLPPAAGAHLRSGAEQARRFARYPGVVEMAAELGLECAFDLALVAPKLPPYPTPDGMDEMGFLRQLVEEGGVARYGPRDGEFVPGAWAQLDHELDLIEHLGFPGYFLVVWDIVEFCRKADILCQGRGSAANSAVCYVLGITKADAVSLGLLFERFLAPERDGPPDIDLDIESDRREEAIQYVYEKHGRRHAAQVANVITYRSRSAVRDAAKALGYAPGQQDAFSKSIDGWTGLKSQVKAERASAGAPVVVPRRDRSPSHGYSHGPATEPRRASAVHEPELPRDVIELAMEFENLPRHLGIHSGGMVMCDRPVIEVCPVEWGRMQDRTVLQWDKEDCAIAGLVKFDLLGLGMLSALHYAVDMIEEHHGTRIDLAALPQEDEVYEMLCRADSVGVFQIESRAQMSTLPRLKPRNFYDLVVEIALIRPGPIQGGSVHPYIRRRNGLEPVTYLHPLLKPALEKTLGIPLFQEQLMQMAIDVSGFTPSEADELRRAMGSKRSVTRMTALKERLCAGMADRGVETEIQEQIWVKLVAFANYGFPESHSISFAYLVYASSWIKLHYPAAFCAALLNAQPMGFYSPHSLVQDARRHGVPTLSPDINESGADADLQVGPTVSEPDQVPKHLSDLGTATWEHQRDHRVAVRLGMSSVRGIGDDMAETIATNRPYRSIEEVARKSGATKEQMEAMATAGCFDSLGHDRRRALWTAGAVAEANRPGTLPGIVTGVYAPQLPGMEDQEEALADLWATGVSPEGHPTIFVRGDLNSMGALRAIDLPKMEHGKKVMVGGVVTHRQRPATASGVTFMSLEDETGLMNVVISVGCWARYRRVARNHPALLIRGRLERTETGGTPVVNVVAERMDPLRLGTASMARDFR
ncbi:MAG: error-prone DNA polymerase [Acidimicrobiales bacterium]